MSEWTDVIVELDDICAAISAGDSRENVTKRVEGVLRVLRPSAVSGVPGATVTDAPEMLFDSAGLGFTVRDGKPYAHYPTKDKSGATVYGAGLRLDWPFEKPDANAITAERVAIIVRLSSGLPHSVPGATPSFTPDDWHDLLCDAADDLDQLHLSPNERKAGMSTASSIDLRALAAAFKAQAARSGSEGGRE